VTLVVGQLVDVVLHVERVEEVDQEIGSELGSIRTHVTIVTE
jgi:hypothetical protein